MAAEILILLQCYLSMARSLMNGIGAKAWAFITAPDDVELWCEFPPKSERTAALTAMIDG